MLNPNLVALLILGCLCAAVWLGRRCRSLLPRHHLTDETKDSVKVAVGLIATMSALLLGLLVSSAKDSYDTVRSQVIQMAAKVAFLDRVLNLYGAEASPLRAQLRTTMTTSTRAMWAEQGHTDPQAVQSGDALLLALQSLTPRDDLQRALRQQALEVLADAGQIRTLLHAESVASISRPLLVVVVVWLLIIFFSFSLFSAPNATATAALTVSAICVAGALFLILELDRPFGGLIQISSEPLSNCLPMLAR
jgi:hypothetical protein